MSLKATCRCGQELTVPVDGSDRVVCRKCGAKVRIRRVGPVEDGFIRFFCPCGRRLKVPSTNPPSHGKCPECARIVPVPLAGTPSLESRTEELRTDEASELDRWAAQHRDRGSRRPRDVGPSADRTPDLRNLPGHPSLVAEPVRSEAGFRVCPQCGRPIHLGSDTCRQCGIVVPRP